MTEKQKKKIGFFKKILLAALLIFAGFCAYKFFFDYDGEVEKNKVEQEIFSINENFAQEESDEIELVENQLDHLSVDDLRRGGATFTYQLLVHNQQQIATLNADMVELGRNFARYKTGKKLSKMILVYVALREKIYGGKNYSKTLKSFEILTIRDNFLRDKISNLKEKLRDFVNYETLQDEFAAVIPDLIAAKKFDYDGGFFDKVKFKIAKVITIRKIDEATTDIDKSILDIEKNLQKYDCKKTLEQIEFLDEKYRKIIAGFSKKVKNICEIENIDEQIMLYFENLS